MGWIPWILSWITPHIDLDRRAKQFVFAILIENPVEFQIARLMVAVKNMHVN